LDPFNIYGQVVTQQSGHRIMLGCWTCWS